MCTFAVIAHRHSTTNTRLGSVLTPGEALRRLGAGDIALGRLDILPTLDGVEPGLWALGRLAALGVTVLNPGRTLIAAHDKLATASALNAANLPHPRTVHIAPWLELPELEPPLVLKPRFGSWGEDVIRCNDDEGVERGLAILRAPGTPLRARSRKSSSPREATTSAWSSPVAEWSEPSSGSPRPVNGGRTWPSAHGAGRSARRRKPARSRSGLLRRSVATWSGSTCCRRTSARGSCWR
jgi:hypothetical protein